MTTITRLIRHREMLIYQWVGWEVTSVDGPHAPHAYLDRRRPVAP